MITQAVGIVDSPANMRKFLLLKRDQSTMGKKNQSQDQPTAKAMSLPSEARDAMIESVADSLEKLVGIVQVLKESTVDDGAQIPEELPRMIKDAADSLSKAAQRFLGEESQSQSSNDGETEKSGEVEKARRLTPRRRSELTAARDVLSRLLDETADSAASNTEEDPSDTEKRDPVLEALATFSEGLKALEQRLEKSAQSSQEAVEKAQNAAADAAEKVSKLQDQIRDPGIPKSRDVEGDAPVTKNNVVWPEDMSAEWSSKR